MPEIRNNASRVRRPKLRLSSLAVAGLMAGSFALNFLRIAREGFGDKDFLPENRAAYLAKIGNIVDKMK